jgi:hypothetical protein
MDWGAKGDGINDDGPAFRAAVAALNWNGKLWVPAGNFLMGSASTVGGAIYMTDNQAGMFITGQGEGVTTITLTSSCPRFCDFQRTADYQTLQNLTIMDMTVDANSTTGDDHVVCGTLQSGWWLGRVNVDNVKVWRVTTLNVFSSSLHSRMSVGIGCSHISSNESTQNTITNVDIGWCSFYGGRFGATVQGAVTGGAFGANVWWDSIRIHDLFHDVLITPTSNISGATVQLGQSGWGGVGSVWNCEGRNSPDVTIEIDQCVFVLVQKCVAVNGWSLLFLMSSYHDPLYSSGGSYASSQTVVFEDCTVTVTINTGVQKFGAFENTGASGVTHTALGTVFFIRPVFNWSKATIDAGAFSNGAMFGINASDHLGCNLVAFVIDGLRAAVKGFTYTSGSATTFSMMHFLFPLTPTGVTPVLRMHDSRIAVSGTQGGAGGLTFRYVGINGTVNVDIDGLTCNHAISGQSGYAWMIDFAQGGPVNTINGSQAFPRGTTTVNSTAGFPTSGTLFIGGVTGSVTYTGLGGGGTTFTGCTGGTGTAANGAFVTLTSTNNVVNTSVTGTVNKLRAIGTWPAGGLSNGLHVWDGQFGTGVGDVPYQLRFNDADFQAFPSDGLVQNWTSGSVPATVSWWNYLDVNGGSLTNPWGTGTGGSGQSAPVSKAVDYAMSPTDSVVKVTVSGKTITLPSGVSAGQRVFSWAVVNASNGGTSVIPPGSQVINNWSGGGQYTSSIPLTIAAGAQAVVFMIDPDNTANFMII